VLRDRGVMPSRVVDDLCGDGPRGQAAADPVGAVGQPQAALGVSDYRAGRAVRLD